METLRPERFRMTTEATATTTTTENSATTAGDATAGTGAATTVQSVASPTSSADWTAGFNDDLKGYIQNKGFKDPGVLAESYRNYEKLMGVPQDLIVKKPKDFNDKAAVNEYYAKLGRPEKPDGYGIDAPEGGNKELAEWAKNEFHSLGLTSQQGKELFAKWNAKAEAMTTAQVEAAKLAYQADESNLKKTWGAAYDQNTLVARQGAAKFGVDASVIESLERQIGYQKTMEFFHKIGAATGEHAFVGGGSGSSPGAMSKEAARQKIAGLMRDQEFRNKLDSKSHQEVSEWNLLHKIAYQSEQ